MGIPIQPTLTIGPILYVIDPLGSQSAKGNVGDRGLSVLGREGWEQHLVLCIPWVGVLLGPH